MVKLSDDLTWALVGKRNSFTRPAKNCAVVLSSEPGNIAAKNEKKYSTLLSKSVGATDDAKGVTILTLATKAAGSKPAKGKGANKINAIGRGTKKCNKTVKTLLS